MKNSSELELVDVSLKYALEGMIILSEDKYITAHNARAEELVEEIENQAALKDIIGNVNEQKLLRDGRLIYYTRNGKSLRFELLPLKKGQNVIRVWDVTDKMRVKEELSEVKQINKELQQLFHTYDDNTIFVTDDKGMILYAGKNCAENCGLTLEELYGYGSVKELEKREIFEPSVTVRVMKSHNIEAVLQRTIAGHECMSIGVPVFNDQGEMISIVSLSRDISSYLRLGNMFAAIKKTEEETENRSILYPELITSSPKFLSIIEVIKLVAPVDSTVLITGQTGTGKDVVSHVIHKMSERRDHKFVKVNCGAIAPNLVESELFGYENGSFTGAKRDGKIGLIESAQGGTVFLDEISELPLEQQVKLLQVLQDKKMTRVGGVQEVEVDVRFLAACNKDLAELVRQNKFREDLYYRLNVIPIELPPLSERKEDIPLLIKHFLKRFNDTYHTQKEFTREAMRGMIQYNWPGNVRELEHMVERLAVMSKKVMIDLPDLPDFIKEKMKREDYSEYLPERSNENLSEAVANLECSMIRRTLEKTKNSTEAAQILGIDQSTLSRKMKKYKLERR